MRFACAMIRIENLDEFIKTVDAWEAETTTFVTQVARGVTVELFKYVVQISPQFSGDFTANWKYELNKVTPSFKEGLFHDRETNFREGNAEAVLHARREAAKVKGFKLGDTVYFHNSAEHEEGYAMKIWKNQIDFRPVNQGNIAARFDDRVQRFKAMDFTDAVFLSFESFS